MIIKCKTVATYFIQQKGIKNYRQRERKLKKNLHMPTKENVFHFI